MTKVGLKNKRVTYHGGGTVVNPERDEQKPGDNLRQAFKATAEHRACVAQDKIRHQEELAAWKPETWLIPKK